MAEEQGHGLNIVLVTNVGPTILRAYFEPLAQLDDVRSLTIIRDSGFDAFAPNVEWYPSGTSSRNAVARIKSGASFGDLRRGSP